MKKMLMVVAVMMVCSFVFADNSARIEVLKKEAEELSKRGQEYQQVLNNIQVELIRKNAQIEELTRLDAEVEPVS